MLNNGYTNVYIFIVVHTYYAHSYNLNQNGMYTRLAQTTQDMPSSWNIRHIYISMWDNTGSRGEL